MTDVVIDFNTSRSGAFEAVLDESAIRLWVEGVIRRADIILYRGMLKGPHTGVLARRKISKVWFRRSVNVPEEEYPAIDTGKLVKSIGIRFTPARFSGIIGTNTSYAKYLRQGTRYMERRKMSDTALRESLERGRPLTGYVKWRSL
jgi:hypothetical protein